jgi:Carboxypeptidase regulatory-like domain
MAIGTRSKCRGVKWAVVLVIAAAIALPATVRAQMAQGAISGSVIGPDDRPVDGATVPLLDPLGNALKSIATKQGDFRLSEIAPGTYSLRADAPPLLAIVQQVTVSTALPVHVNLRVTAVASEQVIVRGDELEPVSTATRVTLAGETVRRAPAARSTFRIRFAVSIA